ncbi:hypothetical protein BDY19DRAFT_991484, partial [Irpex rosettiformis]
SDEEDNISSTKQTVEENQDHSTKTTSRRSRVTKKTSTDETSPVTSAWTAIEDKSEIEGDHDVEVSEEDEDELEDEGDSVDSDIEHLEFRPSTSPIRRRKGMTTETPPTPSPTKNIKKHSAPVSPDVSITADGEESISEPETPVRVRKPRAKKVIKSKEIIEDSDVEEESESERDKLIARESKQAENKISKQSRSAVVALKKKIVVSGTKFPSVPIEDADNNLFLRDDSPLSRSPKKKTKTTHLIESESEGSDDDNIDTRSADDPEVTPVSKITNRLNDSVLNSAKKPKAVVSKAAYKAQLKKFAIDLGLDSLRDFFYESLMDTYAEVYRLSEHFAMLRRSDLLVSIEYPIFGCRNSRGIQARELITTPKITSFIYNPARCDVKDFCLITPPKETVRSRRSYLVHASNNQRVAFLIVGGVALSSLLDLQPIGQSGYSNRSLSICPIAVEYSLAWNFFSRLLKVDRVSNYGGYANFSTFGIRDHNNKDMAGYKHQGYAPPPRTRNASAPVVVHTVGVDYEKSLLQVLKRGIDNGGLDSNSEVFNLSSKYGSLSSTIIPHNIETFVSLCAQGERYRGELPRDSLVAVLCAPNMFTHQDHTDLQFNLIGVVLLSAKYGQGTGTS